MTDLATLLNASTFEGLSLVRQPAGGFVASLMTGLDTHSPWEFSTTPCGAIEKALRLHGQQVVPAPISPPPY